LLDDEFVNDSGKGDGDYCLGEDQCGNLNPKEQSWTKNRVGSFKMQNIRELEGQQRVAMVVLKAFVPKDELFDQSDHCK